MSIGLNLIEIVEPELLFGYGQSMEHPKDGLLLYGPKESPQAGSKLRIGVVSTAEGLRRHSKCVARLAKPIAAAVARATCGLAGLMHMPKGMMFSIGTLSMMLAAG